MSNPPTKKEIRDAGLVTEDVYDATSRSTNIKFPDSMACTKKEKKGQRKNLGIEEGSVRAFTVENFLSLEECDELMRNCDDAGWWEKDDIGNEYPENYRNNQRLITMNEDVAMNLFYRLIFHFEETELMGVKPMGFGAEGIWKPVGLNDCFLFTRYGQGKFFKKHYDGHYKNMRNQISIYSVSCYLNDVEEENGGNLIFYKGSKANAQETFRWKPKAGTAVVFQHDVLHEGEELRNGWKYIFRTSVMFERVADLSAMCILDPNFERMRNIFANFDIYRSAGDPEMFTKKFLEAQELQLQGGKTEWILEDQPFCFGSRDILVNALPFLDLRSIVRMQQCCKSWFLLCRSGHIWKQLYISHFGPNAASMVNPLSLPSEAIDYYGAFALRSSLQKEYCPIIFHLSNLTRVWYNRIRRTERLCVLEFVADGWVILIDGFVSEQSYTCFSQSAIKNWEIYDEFDGDSELWFGGYGFSNIPYDKMKETFLSGEPGKRLSSKLAPGASSSDRDEGYHAFIKECSTLQYKTPRSFFLDLIWPHQFKFSSSSNNDYGFVSDYCRGKEYVESILPELSQQLRLPCIALMECGLAGLLSKNMSGGVVVCFSGHGVVLKYSYKDFRPTDDPEVLELKNWDDMKSDRITEFVVKSNPPDIIMCDLGLLEESDELENHLDETRDDEEQKQSMEQFPKFIVAEIIPHYEAEFRKRNLRMFDFVSERQMMIGGQAFSSSLQFMKSIVHKSEKLGNFLEGNNVFSLSKDIQKVTSSQLERQEPCVEYVWNGFCKDSWRCEKAHVMGCPDMIKTGKCPKDPAICPFQHPPLLLMCGCCKKHYDSFKDPKIGGVCSNCKTFRWCAKCKEDRAFHSHFTYGCKNMHNNFPFLK